MFVFDRFLLTYFDSLIMLNRGHLGWSPIYLFASSWYSKDHTLWPVYFPYMVTRMWTK